MSAERAPLPRIRRWTQALLGRCALACAALSGLAPAVLAAARQGDPADESLSLFGLIQASGFVGWILCAISVVALALVIENFLALRRDKLAPPELIDEVQSLFDEGRYQEALKLCEGEHNLFARVCTAGIAKIGHSFETIRSAIEEMGDEETVRLYQKIGWLTVIAAISPMLGLFGTVQGMILSFHRIATTVNPSPAELAEGIYIALLTTFEGLMVAIPVLLAYAYIKNRLVIAIIEVGAIVEDLFERFRPQP